MLATEFENCIRASAFPHVQDKVLLYSSVLLVNLTHGSVYVQTGRSTMDMIDH